MGSRETSNGLEIKDFQDKYVKTKNGRVGLAKDGIGSYTYVLFADGSYEKCELKELKILEQGQMDYGSYEGVPCCIEFSEDTCGKRIILHIPHNNSVMNIFHGIEVVTDLVEGGKVVQESPYKEITDWKKIKRGDTIYYKWDKGEDYHKEIFRELSRMGDVCFDNNINGYLPQDGYTFYTKVGE